MKTFLELAESYLDAQELDEAKAISDKNKKELLDKVKKS